MTIKTQLNRVSLGLIFAALLLCTFVLNKQPVSAATCPALTNTMGTATTTQNVASAGIYTVWSRIMPDSANAANNSYYLEIDGTTCGVVVGDATIPANTWTWVNYRDGTQSSKITVNLTAGSHTISMIGREDNVKLDRVMLLADGNCTPDNNNDQTKNPPINAGDNCGSGQQDTTAPIVTISSPVSGNVSNAVNISASATDDSGTVASVEIQVDGVSKKTTAGSSATYAWNTNDGSVPNGQHTITVNAKDGANPQNTGTKSVTVTVNNTTPSDSQPPTNVNMTAPANNATVTAGSVVHISVDADDNVGVAKVEFYLDNDSGLLGTDNAGPKPFTFDWTVPALADGSKHVLIAKAYDAIPNSTTSNQVNITISNPPPPDTTKPTVTLTSPSGAGPFSGNINLSATATDNVAVSKVEFYVDNALVNTDTQSPYSFTLNTTTLSNASHTVYAKAYDTATPTNNTNVSATQTFTVNNSVTPPCATANIGDANCDTHVGPVDLSILATHYGQAVTKNTNGDFNNDGNVGPVDLSILATNYGK